MELIKELKSTYLTRPRFKGAKLGALGFLALCVVLSSFYWHHSDGGQLLAKANLVFDGGQYYRLLTSLFIHGDLKHLLSNSFMLLILSYYVIEYYGLKIFFSYAIIFGVITNAITLKTMAPEIGLLGASGVVYFLWGLWLSLYVFIERGVDLSRRFMKVVAITIFLLIPSSFDPQVSYMAHGVGFGAGLIAGVGHFLVFKKRIRAREEYQYSFEPIEDEDEGEYRI